MKNNGIKLFALILSLLCICFIFTGCYAISSQNKKFSVTFKQTGFSDVVIYVDDGGSLTEDQIPVPQPKPGYKLVWESVDLTNIKENIVVNCIESLITTKYTITLNYCAKNLVEQGYVDLSGLPTEITISFNEVISLPKYSSKVNSGYSIESWLYEDGTPFTKTHYDIEGDITLKAKWQWLG